MLPRMRRSLTFLLLVPCLTLGASTSASATVTGFGSGALVGLTSDADSDTIELACIGGEASSEGVGLLPCADVQTIVVKGGEGNDTVNFANVSRIDFPALQAVEIDGGGGQDTINGSQIGDTINADSEDIVNSGPGDDTIDQGEEVNAGEGDDLLSHTAGKANGGAGDDRFESPSSTGPFSGGPGADTFELNLPPENTLNIRFDVENGGMGITTASASTAFFWNSIERTELLLVDGGTQTVDASQYSGSLVADGRGGPDILIGGSGEDSLSGGPGNDELTGGGGFDWVNGGGDADSLRLRDGEADRGVCGDGDDTVIADPADVLAGCEQIDLPAVVTSGAPAAPAAPPSHLELPETRSLKGPKKVVQGKAATFTFGSSERGGTFKCKVDGGPLKTCKSPFAAATGKLAPNKQHTFSVFAIDAAGNADPLTWKFKVAAKPNKP
jgi:Ca2+-binding RTX toxin-like protein